MSKKYTIVIDAEVAGEKDVKKLSENLEQVAQNSDSAAKGMDELNESVDKNTEKTKELTESQSQAAKAAGSFAGTVAAIGIKMWLWRSRISGIIKFLPLLGTAIAVVTGVIIAYNKALASANDYLNSSLEAQQKMLDQTVATKAWASVWEDVSIWFGKFFHSFRDFWSFFKDIVGKNVLRGLGLEQYIEDAENSIEAQKSLNVEWEKSLTIIQKLRYQSEDYLKIINDENRANADRQSAIGMWAAAQLEILKLNKKKLDAEKLLNEAEKNRSDDTEKALIIINRKLEENERLRFNVAMAAAEMSKNITTANVITREEIALISDLETRMQSLIDLTDDTDELIGISSFAESYAEALRKFIESQDNYELYLEESATRMAGIWGEYFKELRYMYGEDFDWLELTSKQKTTVILRTAQISLGIAGMLVDTMSALAKDDFEKQKKYQIAAATISTLQGMVSAYMGGVATIPVPAPAGVALGIVMAALVGIAGFANIQQIKSTTLEGGGSSPAAMGGSAPSVSAAPSLSLVSPVSAGDQQISGALGDITNEPAKAYVVSEDMTTQQALDRRIENNSTL